MALTIDLAVAKTHKFASRESGDTVEVVERPGGGISVVLVDAQGSGPGAKRLSLQIAGRTISLLNEGVRDGAAARAAHDFLFALRGGKVSAALDIVSIDLSTASVLFTRNSEVPMLLTTGEARLTVLPDSSGRIGYYRHTRPRVLEYPAAEGLIAAIFSDGVVQAGARQGRRLDLAALAERSDLSPLHAQAAADAILETALALDDGRPKDDMTVIVLKLASGTTAQPIRRLSVSLPSPD